MRPREMLMTLAIGTSTPGWFSTNYLVNVWRIQRISTLLLPYITKYLLLHRPSLHFMSYTPVLFIAKRWSRQKSPFHFGDCNVGRITTLVMLWLSRFLIQANVGLIDQSTTKHNKVRNVRLVVAVSLIHVIISCEDTWNSGIRQRLSREELASPASNCRLISNKLHR